MGDEKLSNFSSGVKNNLSAISPEKRGLAYAATFIAAFLVNIFQGVLEIPFSF